MTGKFSIITSAAIKKIIKSQSHSIYEMVNFQEQELVFFK